jgi:hypothetical protein
MATVTVLSVAGSARNRSVVPSIHTCDGGTAYAAPAVRT